MGKNLLASTRTFTCRLHGKEGLQPLLGRFIAQSRGLLVTSYSLSQAPPHTKALLKANSQVVPAL